MTDVLRDFVALDLAMLRDFTRHLPEGDIEVVRAPSGKWDVAIFVTGATVRLATIAHDMDRSVATVLKIALNAGRRQ